MAPTAASPSAPSSSSLSSGMTALVGPGQEEVRPQAGPLPVKRGEIGYSEEVHGQQQQDGRSIDVALPERHPADRDAPPSIGAASGPPPSSSPSNGTHTQPPTVATTTTTTTTTNTTPSPPSSSDPTNASTDSLSAQSAHKRKLIAFLKPKHVPSYGGLRLTSLLAFLALFILFGGTIAGWVLATMRLNRSFKAAAAAETATEDPTAPSSTTSSAINSGSASGIFVHVIFGLLCLCELVFLERRVFRLRAERYSYLHHGEVLPTSRRRYIPDNANMPLAPWLRPPLPTYAAALAQSGHGTGDVEDHVIAQPPPPAYGHTRGSTLLLSGFLRNSLRVQIDEGRQQQRASQMSERSDGGGGSRPVSYMSHDEGWEEVRNAERARRLEETLDTLERPATARSQTGQRRM